MGVHTMHLKEIPIEERPRERLLSEGVEALSVAELLAIVLGSGTQGKSVLWLAWELIEHFGGVESLIEASVPELMEVKGIGPVKAIQLRAVFGIALKYRGSLVPQKTLIRSAVDAYQIASARIAHVKKEVLIVLLRDARGRLIHVEKVGEGTVSEVIAHPREVFYSAICHQASSLIVAHNHPSGDPSPSQADIDLTTALAAAGHVLSIRLDDHLIVCKHHFVSMREMGCFPHLNQTRY